MIQFLVFAGQVHYSIGGAKDLVGSFEEQGKAEDFAKGIIGKEAITTVLDEASAYYYEDDEHSIIIEWSHVLCLKSMNVIASFGKEPLGLHYNIKQIDM